MEEFFRQTQAKIDGKSHILTSGLGCWLWQGGCKFKSQYGVIKITPPGHKAMVKTVHRVKYMCANRNLDIPRQMDVSHLCHNPKCVRLGHLSLEPHNVNMTRLECKNLGFCIKNHDPPCLFLKVGTSQTCINPTQPKFYHVFLAHLLRVKGRSSRNDLAA